MTEGGAAPGFGGQPPPDAPLDFLRPGEDAGLQPEGAPPAFVPTPPFVPQWRPVPVPPPRPRRAAPRPVRVTRTRKADAGPPPATAGRARRGPGWPLLLVLVLVVGPVLLSPLLARPRPAPVNRPTTASPAELAAAWSITPGQLRPDAIGVEFGLYPDGSFDGPRIVDAGTVWVALSEAPKAAPGTPVVAHGLDPASGRELWRRDLPHGLCAARLLRGSLVCAEALDWDAALGQATHWRVHLLDPLTGAPTSSRELEGSPSVITVQHERVLFLEQRQPSPHAVVTALDAALAPAFTLDLAGIGSHDEMFSENRILGPTDQPASGLALDRPRVREVADGLTAFWVGGGTAFVDARTGRLVGLPYCSRLVDDGHRLWCNNPGNATSYDYDLAPGVQTDLGIRLAFPSRDARDGDVCLPVFLDANGRAMRVDPNTGLTLGTLFASRNGEAFGMTISPTVYYSGGHVLISDQAGSASVDLVAGAVRWQAPKLQMDGLLSDGPRLYAVWSGVTLLDAATGDTLGTYRQRHGLYTDAVNDVLVGVGPDEVARLVKP